MLQGVPLGLGALKLKFHYVHRSATDTIFHFTAMSLLNYLDSIPESLMSTLSLSMVYLTRILSLLSDYNLKRTIIFLLYILLYLLGMQEIQFGLNEIWNINNSSQNYRQYKYFTQCVKQTPRSYIKSKTNFFNLSYCCLLHNFSKLEGKTGTGYLTWSYWKQTRQT